MNDDEFNELIKKGYLTDEEMELVTKDGPVIYKMSPDFKKVGVTDLQRNAKNLPMMQSLISRARKNSFYLEEISLILLTLDFYLRTHYTAKTGKSFDSKKQFGDILKCTNKEAGLDPSLYGLLLNFNETRKKSIHRFVLGEITYDEIGIELKKYEDLVECTFMFVFSELPDK